MYTEKQIGNPDTRLELELVISDMWISQNSKYFFIYQLTCPKLISSKILGEGRAFLNFMLITDDEIDLGQIFLPVVLQFYQIL